MCAGEVGVRQKGRCRKRFVSQADRLRFYHIMLANVVQKENVTSFGYNRHCDRYSSHA